MNERAVEADDEAERAERERDALRAQLGERWLAVMATYDAFEYEREAVEQCRKSAERLPELNQARWQLGNIETSLDETNLSISQIPETFRVPVDFARAEEASARDKERQGVELKTQCEASLVDLERRRQRAAECTRFIEDAQREMETFAELADLLSDGGSIQTEIAEQEQTQIAQAVNQILAQLGDPLRVSLGAARRSRGLQLQDIHIVDTSDPVGKPRFLSFCQVAKSSGWLCRSGWRSIAVYDPARQGQ